MDVGVRPGFRVADGERTGSGFIAVDQTVVVIVVGFVRICFYDFAEDYAGVSGGDDWVFATGGGCDKVGAGLGDEPRIIPRLGISGKGYDWAVPVAIAVRIDQRGLLVGVPCVVFVEIGERFTFVIFAVIVGVLVGFFAVET